MQSFLLTLCDIIFDCINILNPSYTSMTNIKNVSPDKECSSSSNTMESAHKIVMPAKRSMHIYEKSALQYSISISATKNVAKKILIVDDHPLCRKFLRLLLQERGHYCEEASNGLIGLNMVKATFNMSSDDLHIRDYDVIIMDFHVKAMSGIQSITEIRKLGYNGLIIGTTSIDCNDDVMSFINAGANKTFIKPLNLCALYEILE